MDNNNTLVQPPPVISPVPTPTGNSSNKMVILFLAGFVVIILAVGGIYMYLSNQQATSVSVAENTNTALPAPKRAEVKDALDADLEAIDVASKEADFKSVDSDLQSL